MSVEFTYNMRITLSPISSISIMYVPKCYSMKMSFHLRNKYCATNVYCQSNAESIIRKIGVGDQNHVLSTLLIIPCTNLTLYRCICDCVGCKKE